MKQAVIALKFAATGPYLIIVNGVRCSPMQLPTLFILGMIAYAFMQSRKLYEVIVIDSLLMEFEVLLMGN